NASVTDAAKVLDEAFNGPKQGGAQQGPVNPFFGRFGFGGAPPPPNPTEGRIRVVAYPPTNALLVRASPVDMLQIRQLIGKALDTPANAPGAVIKTFVAGPLQHANAVEVANVLRDVYREMMNNNPLPGQIGGFSRFSRFAAAQNQNVDASGNPRAVTLSVGVDNQTNSIVVSCPTALHKDIETL